MLKKCLCGVAAVTALCLVAVYAISQNTTGRRSGFMPPRQGRPGVGVQDRSLEDLLQQLAETKAERAALEKRQAELIAAIRAKIGEHRKAADAAEKALGEGVRGRVNEAQLRERFRMLDRNGDGKLTPDEVRGRMSKDFALWDKNSDGSIDFDEFKEYYIARRGDGKDAKARLKQVTEACDLLRINTGFLPLKLVGYDALRWIRGDESSGK